MNTSLTMLVGLGLLLGLTGCGNPVFSNADTMIKSSLQSPSSYKAISHKEIWKGKRKGNDAYVVRVEYDASNLFGANLRECVYVAYWIEDGYVMGDKNYSTAFECIDAKEKDVLEILVGLISS